MMADEPTSTHREYAAWHVPLVGIMITLLLAIGGWVFWFGGEALAVSEITRRVTTLEQRRDSADRDTNDIISRLARIEGMVAVMLTHTDEKK